MRIKAMPIRRWPIDQAYQNRDNDLWYIKGDWLFTNLAQDPRYRTFLRKMNLPE